MLPIKGLWVIHTFLKRGGLEAKSLKQLSWQPAAAKQLSLNQQMSRCARAVCRLNCKATGNSFLGMNVHCPLVCKCQKHTSSPQDVQDGRPGLPRNPKQSPGFPTLKNGLFPRGLSHTDSRDPCVKISGISVPGGAASTLRRVHSIRRNFFFSLRGRFVEHLLQSVIPEPLTLMTNGKLLFGYFQLGFHTPQMYFLFSPRSPSLQKPSIFPKTLLHVH